ncbi:sel1 repeat family protein [Aestuariirhabdus sp. Z084]|uniref:tetratricopeptide repeat protein n=1 Tax=Aestuariirhabdus haliotis TaxID=2918751 RepID=UPI00201B42F7|nr:tetratricopeptide repeat protein [Aestuariirhabdus haliotis]MCL6416729.1 sel1 repeat family protein [Aestuariirhabdus haliotis]MCL6420729.1 sel1 repeat family protein [Aestuariirhabdus haliotis]
MLAVFQYPKDAPVKTFLAVFFSLLFSSSILAADLATGVNAYDNGDYDTAAQHIPELAKQGDATAQLYLGNMYEYGQGVAENIETAAQWYTASAEQGNPSGQSYLGDMYLSGTGVPQDTQVAIKWYTLAAEQGDSMAQLNLGSIYQNGDGVEPDAAKAYLWYSIAEANGEDSGELEDLASSLSAEQLTAAKQQATDWLAKHPH